MTILFCKQGGLQEDPKWHWEIIGSAPGETTKEVADNLAKSDEKFKEDYDPEGVTYWGWGLAIDIESYDKEEDKLKRERIADIQKQREQCEPFISPYLDSDRKNKNILAHAVPLGILKFPNAKR